MDSAWIMYTRKTGKINRPSLGRKPVGWFVERNGIGIGASPEYTTRFRWLDASGRGSTNDDAVFLFPKVLGSIYA